MTHQDRTMDLSVRIATLDWDRIAQDLNVAGYVVIQRLLNQEESENLLVGYDSPDAFRKTVVMARYRFGLGEYKYWKYPLPEIVHTLRQELYPHLVPIINDWLRKLGIAPELPDRFDQMQALCQRNGQKLPTPLILRYGKGGFNTLHQDLYGEVYFPVQAVINLSEPGEDFEGGEFVLTEQVPRAQSKATVVSPRRGDMIIFTTSFRPVRGSRGYHRANMRHGVSEIRSGSRTAVGIIFHEATS